MPDAPYILDELQLSGFRAFLILQRFDFGTKRCLAVFAPNGSGKSSLVDALEFMFSDDGTLKRLGVRTIHNNAGVSALVHNLAVEKKISPQVSIRFKCGDVKSEGSREARGSARARPAIADTVGACFLVDPLIRGHELRRFVESQTSEERYRDVARWLQLGPLVEVQRNLRSLRQRTKAAAEDHADLKRVDVELAKKSANAVRAWDEKAVLIYANNILALHDEALSLMSLSRADPSFITVQGRAEAEELPLGLEGLRQVRRSVAVLYEEKVGPDTGGTIGAGLLHDLAAAVDVRTMAEKIEVEERNTAADAVFSELWKSAEPFFAEGKPALYMCPVCTTPIVDSAAGSVEGVRHHIAAHQAKLANYAKAKKALEAASVAVSNLHTKLGIALGTLMPLLAEEHADLKAAIVVYQNAVTVWDDETVPDDSTLKTAIHKFTMAIDARIAEVEAKQRDSTYIKALRKLEELIELKDKRKRAVRLLDKLEKLSTALSAQAGYISICIRKKVQSLLDTLQGPINDIYRHIQGDSAAPIRLELPSEDDTNQHRLNLVIDFSENRAGVQPGGYLSDSQIHSLALALRLAAIKCFNFAAPIIALDDIVTSYDANHRRAIAALLAKEFADFQIIVTTHDERFFCYLKDQLESKHWNFKQIIRLDPDYGPRFHDHRVTETMIELRWDEGKSAANEMRQAEEEWLLMLCRDFGVNLRIRQVQKAYSYERSELAAALGKFLKDRGHTPPMVPGVNNRFLTSLVQGTIENFGSHFQDSPFGDGSIGDEMTRWSEFKVFRDHFVCPNCGKARFKRPFGINKAVCANEGCEAQFAFAATDSLTVQDV
jgi:energy-coupling factor transporter ATP-binding protein EcfA2